MADRKVYIMCEGMNVRHIGSTGWRLFNNLKQYVFGEKKMWMLYQNCKDYDNDLIITECTHAAIQKLIKQYEMCSEVPLEFMVVASETKPVIVDLPDNRIMIHQILVE